MSGDTVNRTPYLRTSREFSEEPKQLTTDLNKSYQDIANSVNSRTIGVYPSNKPSNGGETWYVGNSNKLQNLRQVYTFTAAGNIPHGLNYSSINQFTKCSGAYTDVLRNWYGVIFASSVPIAGQISFYVDPVNIVIVPGGGAPVITRGTIVLEWLSVT